MSIEIQNFKLLTEGKAEGEFTVFMKKGGMVLRKCRVFKKENGSRWITLPSFSVEKEWFPYFQFHNKSVHQEFVKRISEALSPFLDQVRLDTQQEMF